MSGEEVRARATRGMRASATRGAVERAEDARERDEGRGKTDDLRSAAVQPVSE